jgi:AcrR family transcriptional regulator
MKAPSLYSHFASKAAIYDAMFREAWIECREVMLSSAERAPAAPRERLAYLTRTFFDYCIADSARHQLMNLRPVPGFEPTPEAYQPAVETLDAVRAQLREAGVPREEDLDLLVAIIGGLIDAQQSNDPGGDRWSRLLDRAIEMFADSVGLPRTTTRRAT